MMAHTLAVGLGDRTYPIHIGPGLIEDPLWFAPLVGGRRAALITDEVVAPLYARSVEKSLFAGGASVLRITIPDGEAQKCWKTLEYVHGELLRDRADRRTIIVALGGGVVGDLAGFAAATYQRGIAFIQVPTTLLAQVDSSVGGKTGINHPLGKNMVGAFYQPLAVVSDTDTLATLPERDFSAGLAEVVKYGAIRDLDFFRWLEEHIEGLRARDASMLTFAIRRCCEIKAAIVAQDEREAGPRALLNFGHTFGHAIESLQGYGNWLHGEAVAAGMMMAARLSSRLGKLCPSDLDRIERLLVRAGLPVSPPRHPVKQWLDAMGRDKKNEAGNITLILLEGLGAGYIEKRAPPAELEALLAA